MGTRIGYNTENASGAPPQLPGTPEPARPVCGLLARAPPARRNPRVWDPKLEALSFFRTEAYLEGPENPAPSLGAHHWSPILSPWVSALRVLQFHNWQGRQR